MAVNLDPIGERTVPSSHREVPVVHTKVISCGCRQCRDNNTNHRTTRTEVFTQNPRRRALMHMRRLVHSTFWILLHRLVSVIASEPSLPSSFAQLVRLNRIGTNLSDLCETSEVVKWSWVLGNSPQRVLGQAHSLMKVSV